MSDEKQPSMLSSWPPMTIIPGSAAPPEAEARDLGYRRKNKWFPKAFGLWRVQGGAWPCFLGLRPTLVAYSVMDEFNPVGQFGAKYCRPCGLVQRPVYGKLGFGPSRPALASGISATAIFGPAPVDGFGGSPCGVSSCCRPCRILGRQKSCCSYARRGQSGHRSEKGTASGSVTCSPSGIRSPDQSSASRLPGDGW